MALFDQWKSQYQFSYLWSTPYEGRVFTDALYENDPNDPRIAYITLNRPQKANALSDIMWEDILAGLHQAADDPDVRVVVLKANGAGFCSGHDITAEREVDGRPTRQSQIINPKYRPTVRDYINLERRRCTKETDVLAYPKIVIAQVHGYAVMAGEYLVRAADIAIAAEDTRFGTVAGHQLETLPVGAWWYGHPADSRKRGQGSLLQLDGKRAAEAGLIGKAVPKEDLEAEVRRLAAALAELPRRAVLMAKSAINEMLMLNGLYAGQRAHFADHVSLQFTRFRPGEVGMYQIRREAGVKEFVRHREQRSAFGEFKLPGEDDV